MMLHSIGDLKYFKEPIFIWTDLPDQMCNVIITYLVGGILPISALLLTEMLTSYLYKEEDNPVPVNPVPTKEEVKGDTNKEPENKTENEQVQEQTNQEEEAIQEDGRVRERDNSRSEESESVVNEADEGDTQNLIKEEAKPEQEISKPNLKSQFLNI